MNLNNFKKLKIIHPPVSEESHPVTDPLEETVKILRTGIYRAQNYLLYIQQW